MARCKDCLHYDICSRVEACIMRIILAGDKADERCKLFKPTADVVPKSEVEMLQGALKAEERHNELTMECAKKALANAKTEVAREIFEEIRSEIKLALKSNYAVRDDLEDSEELFHNVSGKISALRGIDDFIDELEIKYTEEKNE